MFLVWLFEDVGIRFKLSEDVTEVVSSSTRMEWVEFGRLYYGAERRV
jgi:hypothetical protein